MRMEDTYWLPQTQGQALFEDILWSKPEQRRLSGKLAVIGGNSHGFNSVSESYSAASKAGAGVIRTLLPDSLRRSVGKIWPECEFAPSTKIGSFSYKSLNDWLALSEWADAVLLSGDLTHNSETAILLERFLEKSTAKLTLATDAVDIIISTPSLIFDRSNLFIACDINQLQKLLTGIRFPTAATSNMTLRQLVDLLHSLTLSYPIGILILHDKQAYAALQGRVSTTPFNQLSLGIAAAAAAVWGMQQPTKRFEAITTALYELANSEQAQPDQA